MIEQEQAELEVHRNEALQEQLQQQATKRQQKEALIDDLVCRHG